MKIWTSGTCIAAGGVEERERNHIFGNYFEKPTTEEIGQIIVDELKAVGFFVQWNGTAKTKIVIKNFKAERIFVQWFMEITD